MSSFVSLFIIKIILCQIVSLVLDSFDFFAILFQFISWQSYALNGTRILCLQAVRTFLTQ